MGVSLDKLVDPQRLDKLWNDKPTTGWQPGAVAPETLVQVFANLRAKVEAEVTQPAPMLAILLDEASKLIAEQNEGDLPKPALAKNQAALRKVLDDLEDLLDMLLLLPK